MNRRSRLLGLPLAAALALVGCGGGASPAPATGSPGEAPATSVPAETAAPVAAGPIDACALLSTEAVGPVVPDASASGAAETGGPVETYRCTWTTSAPGKIMALTVNAQPGLLTYLAELGADVGALRSEITTKANDPDVRGRLVDGLGDVAAARFDDYDNQVHVVFLADDTKVEMYYVGDDGQDAESKVDAVVELARAVAGRLP